MDGVTDNSAEHASPQTAEAPRDPSRRPKHAVCTACRQSKVRCSGFQDGAACQRCVKLGRECHNDPGFKRMSKSRKIAELEKQVQTLMATMKPIGKSFQTSQVRPVLPLGGAKETGSGESLTSAPLEGSIWQQHPRPPLSLLQTTGRLPANNGSLDKSVQNTFSGSSITRPPAVMSQILGTVHCSAVEIDLLFNIFFEHYHHFLPFLDASKSPDAYYKSSISLFWVIIGVAARRYREDVTLLHVLSDLVMKLVWTEISKPPYKLSTVQAVILLCIWPFPTTSTWNDVSVTMSSIAISIAMQVGLHKPFNTQDFSRMRPNANIANEMDLGVITRTWAVANIVSQLSGAAAGHLPIAPFDWTIDRACENGNIYTLPDELRLKLIIERFSNRVTRAMQSITHDPVDSGVYVSSSDEPLSLQASWGNEIAMLEKELDALESENEQLFTMVDRLYLATARLYLHSFYFFDSSTTEARKHGILKAYKSAVTLISLFTTEDATGEALLYLPYSLFRMLLTAACVVLKVLKSSYAPELGDAEYGRITLNQSMLALSRSSVSNNDTGGKAVKLISQIWHSSSKSKEQSPPLLYITSRYGASIIYDFIYCWKKEFGVLPKTNPGFLIDTPNSQSSTGQSNPLEEDSVFNLDFLDDSGWSLAESLVF